MKTLINELEYKIGIDNNKQIVVIFDDGGIEHILDCDTLIQVAKADGRYKTRMEILGKMSEVLEELIYELEESPEYLEYIAEHDKLCDWADEIEWNK